jgi:hypothetical protein
MLPAIWIGNKSWDPACIVIELDMCHLFNHEA